MRYSYTTTTEIEIDFTDIVGDIKVFRLVTRSISTNPKIADNETIQQGVIGKQSHIASLKRGIVPNTRDFFVATPEMYAAITRFGYAGFSDDNSLWTGSDTIYDYVSANGELKYILRFDRNDHSFWNVDGSILPTGINFDYMKGYMHDRCYDLTKAAAILQARGDITFIGENNRYGGNVTQAVIDKDVARQVPYYNADSCRQFLEFFWTPSAEQVAEFHKQSKFYDPYKIIFDNDWLGLRAGGVAYFDDFYKSVDKSDGGDGYNYDD